MKNEEDLVKKALKFAAQKHKNQTFTDGSGMPYIEHCKRVYWNLKKYASGEFEKKDVLFATALLHDTIEDTDTTFEELVQNFGEEVARNVKALSKQPSFFPHFLKMEVYLHDIASTSKEAMMVKLADRITNITHIHPLWDYEKVVEYLDDSKMIYHYLGSANKGLKKELKKRIENYQVEINEKFQTNEKVYL